MRFFRLIPVLLIGMGVMILSSCEKEENNTFAPVDQPLLQDPISQELGVVAVKNSRLVFKSYDALSHALGKVSEYTAEELNEWEENIGFSSIRNKRNEALEAYEKAAAASEAEFADFLKKYRDHPYISVEDGSIITGIQGVRSALTPFDQTLYVGEALVKFTTWKTITILDGSEDKLLLAERSNQADLSQGIFIAEIKHDGSRTYCPLNTFDEDKDSDNNKRLRYWVSIFAVVNFQGSTMTTQVFYEYDVLAQKKNCGWCQWISTWIDLNVTALVQAVVEYGGAGITNSPLLSNSFNDSFTAVNNISVAPRVVGAHTSPVAPSIQLNLETIDAEADRVESPNTNDLQCTILCF